MPQKKKFERLKALFAAKTIKETLLVSRQIPPTNPLWPQRKKAPSKTPLEFEKTFLT